MGCVATVRSDLVGVSTVILGCYSHGGAGPVDFYSIEESLGGIGRGRDEIHPARLCIDVLNTDDVVIAFGYELQVFAVS